MPCFTQLLVLALLVGSSAAGCALKSHALPTDAAMDSTDAADALDALDAADTTPPEACIPNIEACNGSDDDCDGRADEDFDTATDPENCGACSAACDPDPAHGAAACVAGTCRPLCDDLFADCNGDAADGCEALLNAAATCGDCDLSCRGTTPLCQEVSGALICVGACGMGTSMCGASCADTRRDVSNCGSCGMACPDPDHAAATCVTGRCGFACDDGWADCDGDPVNGCETSLDDPASCGACGNDCARPNAIPSCLSRTCAFACQAGYGDCDSAAGNGCETDLDTASAHCGACGAACGAGQLCAGGACFDDCGGVPCARDCTPGSPCACTTGTCSFSCGEADCEASCAGSGTSCTLSGASSSTLVGTCTGGADCTFLARFSSSVVAECSGAGTVCVVDCRNASSCVVDCHDGAECQIRCNGSASCGYSRCEGGEAVCGGNQYCNRGC